MAARNSGGLVIVQVERIAERGTLNSRQVKIPGILVDCVVVADAEQPPADLRHRLQPRLLGRACACRRDRTGRSTLGLRKVIARRAAMELRANSVVNLGIGMPEGVAAVAAEEKISDLFTLTAEPGVIGGMPAGGLDFGAAINAQAMIDQPYQFDFYDGGGLDVALLGLAQADAEGNVNVSKFGPRLAGAGGFINISQSAKKVVFVGSFCAGECELAVVEAGGLRIVRDGTATQVRRPGRAPHLLRPPRGRERPGGALRHRALRVPSCAPDGLELIEIAPGIDLERDVLAHMDFRPHVDGPLATMDARIFGSEPMGLRAQLVEIPVRRPLRLRPGQQHAVPQLRAPRGQDARRWSMRSRARCEAICEPLGRRVHAVVNYEGFVLDREVEDALGRRWSSEVVERWYDGVTRFTTSAFLRAKLGEALARRKLAPHIFETEEEAIAALPAACETGRSA